MYVNTVRTGKQQIVNSSFPQAGEEEGDFSLFYLSAIFFLVRKIYYLRKNRENNLKKERGDWPEMIRNITD